MVDTDWAKMAKKEISPPSKKKSLWHRLFEILEKEIKAVETFLFRPVHITHQQYQFWEPHKIVRF